MTNKKSKIICFGEILWDVFPTEKIAAGSPMNVAYYATQLGIDTQMISKIGKDELGVDLMKFLHQKKINTQLIQTDENLQTGIANVKLHTNGSTSYEIIEPVAWDYIYTTAANKTAVKNSDAFVFGSLAARNHATKNTLLTLLKLAKLKIFDVNLRASFYSKPLLIELFKEADIVKMNDEELQIIGALFEIKDTLKITATLLKIHFNWQQLIITRSTNEAWLFYENGMISSSSIVIQVQDTMGSDDSFVAAFLCKLLENKSPKKCLQFAVATAAYIATKKGGTPEFSEAEILKLIDD